MATRTKKKQAANTETGKARAAQTQRPNTGNAPSSAGDAVQRENMIREAAYYLAEKQGFSGDPRVFWQEAEKEIESKLRPGKKRKK